MTGSNKIPQSIETERLILKSYLNGDEIDFLAFVKENREHLKRFDVLDKWTINIDNIEDAKKYVKQMQVGWLMKKIFAYSVWQKTDNKYIGEYKLFRVNWDKKELELGGFISKEFEGLLFPREICDSLYLLVFKSMEFNKINGICRKDNVVPRFWIERSKFFKKDSETVTHIYYSMTCENYFMQQKKY